MIYVLLSLSLGLNVALIWAILHVQGQFADERYATQVRHLEYCLKLQEDIRNLTASIVRSSGGSFLMPPAEVKKTEQWFTPKPVIVPENK